MTPGQGIFLPANTDLELNVFCDDDWGGCTNDMSILHEFFFFLISLGDALISWLGVFTGPKSNPNRNLYSEKSLPGNRAGTIPVQAGPELVRPSFNRI